MPSKDSLRGFCRWCCCGCGKSGKYVVTSQSEPQSAPKSANISHPVTKGPIVKLKNQTDGATNPRQSASKDSGFLSTFESESDKDRLNLIPYIDDDADEVKVGRRYKLVTQPSTEQESNGPVLPIRLFNDNDDLRQPLINRYSMELNSSPGESVVVVNQPSTIQQQPVVTNQPVKTSFLPPTVGRNFLQIDLDNDSSRRSSVRSEDEFSQVFQVIRQNDNDILVMKQQRDRSETPKAADFPSSLMPMELIEIREPLATSSPLPKLIKSPAEPTAEEILSTRQTDDQKLISAAENAEKILDSLNISKPTTREFFRSDPSCPQFQTPRTPPPSSANLMDLDGEEEEVDNSDEQIQLIRSRIAQLESTVTTKTLQITTRSDVPSDYTLDDFTLDELKMLAISSETGEGARLIDNSTRITCSPHDFKVKQEYLTHLSHMLIDDCREFHKSAGDTTPLHRYYLEVPEYDDSVRIPVLKLRSDGLCKLKEKEEETVIYRF